MSLPPYRHVPPLEMTVLAGRIQSFSGANYPKRCPAPVISTAAKRSGEISLRNVASPGWQEISRLCVSLEPKVLVTIPAHSPARDDGVGGLHTVILGIKLPQTLPRPRHFDRSEAEWRNLTPKCGKPMVSRDLPALRFNKVQSFCHPYRQVPLEMTIPAGSIQSFPEGQIDQNDAPHSRHFDRSEAEWRNLTPKCGKSMVSRDLPALRFIRAQNLCHPYRQVPSR